MTHLRWEHKDPGPTKKSPDWYWTVGICAGGIAVASFIIGNFLFAVVALAAGFAIMLAGSRGGAHRTYALSDKGLHIGHEVIPYENMARFAIEADPPRLLIATTSLLGTIAVPLDNVDPRTIEMELKNHNIEAADRLHSLSDQVAKAIGM